MRTITFLNIKGGVGKTTSALAVSQILTDEYTARVLLIDADQQGNATRALLPEGGTDDGCARLLTAREQLSPQECITRTPYNIDLVCGGFSLMEANRACLLDSTRPQQSRFKRQLSRPEISDAYDYCVIDCPPDISMAAINALVASDLLLVPVRADKYGFSGLSYVFSTVKELAEWGEGPRTVECLLTMVNARTNLAKYTKEVLQTTGVPAMKTSIRACTKVGESSFDKPLLRYAPHCSASEDYRSLTRELLALL